MCKSLESNWLGPKSVLLLSSHGVWLCQLISLCLSYLTCKLEMMEYLAWNVIHSLDIYCTLLWAIQYWIILGIQQWREKAKSLVELTFYWIIANNYSTQNSSHSSKSNVHIYLMLTTTLRQIRLVFLPLTESLSNLLRSHRIKRTNVKDSEKYLYNGSTR